MSTSDEIVVMEDEDTKPASRPSIASSSLQDHDHCLVCYSELSYSGITPCGHDEVCGICHLRLRYLHKDKKCPMCKQENDQIIVDYSQTKVFDEYPIWGEELGSDFCYRQDVGVFFNSNYYQNEILPLFGYHCTAPNCSYDGTTPDENIYEQQQNKRQNRGKKEKTPLRHLQDHLRNKHRLTLCQLCVDFKRDFVSQLPRFSPTKLKHHMTKGDGAGSGFKGHPVCEFCRPKRFYDLTQLHLHLQKDHYKCHVCEKQGRHNQFFRNYNSLERHFDQEHFLCHDVQCLTARFVVFENEIDLRGHELNTHGGTSTGSTKIQLEFRVRRAGHDGAGVAQDVPTNEDFSYGLDGQAFVPEDLPQEQESRIGGAVSSHPEHVARTAAIIARAEEVRELSQMNQQEEAFPSLNGAAESSGGDALRMGWTTEGSLRSRTQVGEVTTEQFPSLPKASKKKSVAAKIRAPKQPRGGASATTAAAISAASWPAGSSGVSSSAAEPPRAFAASAFPPPSFGATSSSAAAVASRNHLHADNFPALGGGSSLGRATAASSVASRNHEANLNPNNFPALGGGSGTTQRYAAAEALTKKNQGKKKPSQPSISNLSEFPPPPTASASGNNKKPSVKHQMLGDQKAPSQAALANVLNFPPPSSQDSLAQGRATTGQMKASLGPSNYKRLKKLTKDFAADDIPPESYVDQAAALFDTGYGDPDFWSFVPSLLESSPNQGSSQQAMRYMKQLRVNSASNGPSRVAAPSTFSTASLAAAVPSTSNHAYHLASTTRSAAVPNSRKKKTAWNSGGATSVVKAKAAPGSVSGGAVQEAPQSGTATKYMAKEKKQQQKQQQQGGKKKKKKERDELRALAFGK